MAPPAGASTQVTVGHADLSSSCAPTTFWYSNDDVSLCGAGQVSFVNGPGTPPLGTGSVQIATALSSDRSVLANLDPAYGNLPFANLTRLEYSSLRSSVDAGNNLSVALQFDVDYDLTDTTTAYQGRIVFEPYQTFPGGVPQNTWQTWNTLSGKWWGSSTSPKVGNVTVAQVCSQSSPCTWAQFLAAYPNAGTRPAPADRLLFKAGNTWPGFVGNVDAFTIGVNGADTTYDFEPVHCTATCYVDPAGNDANSGLQNDPFRSIQQGIDTVSPGGTVDVRPGSYNETAANRTITASNGGPNGPHQFGLFVSRAQSGITIQGVTSGDVPIASAAGVQAHITTNATNNFGYSGVFVEGDNVTIRGLAIGANIPGQDKTIEAIGDNFTLDRSDIEDYYGSVSLDDWAYNESTQTPHILSYNITNDIFRHGVSLDIWGGPGGGANGGPISGRVVSGNTFEGDTNPEHCPGCVTGEVFWPAIAFNGAGTTVSYFVDPVGAATITGNTFGASDQYIRHRHGAPDTAVFSTWASYWANNTFGRAAMATTDGNPAHIASYSYSVAPQVERIGGTIQTAHATGCLDSDCQGELAHTPVGGSVLLSAATFDEAVTVDHSVSVLGARAGVDARTRSGSETILTEGSGKTPLSVSASDVTINGVTVEGNTDGNLVGAGVYLEPGTHGTQFLDNIVRNNIIGLYLANNLGSDPTLIRQNLFQDNDNPGPAQGTDIYADQFTAGGPVTGATVDANAFTNTSFQEDAWALGISNTDAGTRFSGITFSNNSIDNHGRGAYFFSTANSAVTGNSFTPGPLNHYAFGVFNNGGGDSNTNIAISGNTLGCVSCSGAGVRVDDDLATGIAVNRNDISGYGGAAPGITSAATAPVDGRCNWWGSATGPSVGAVTGPGSVTATPWLLSSNLLGSCVIPAVAASGPLSTVETDSGSHVVNVPVTLSGPVGANVTVHYATSDGPGAHSATAGSDYVATSGDLTFAPGVTTQNVPVTVNGDTALEFDETFTVTLSAPVNATFGSPTTTAVTIKNDDAPGVGLVGAPTIDTVEGNSGSHTVTLTAQLDHPTVNTVVVPWNTFDITATAASNDYIGIPAATISFAPGQTSATFTVTVNGDVQVEDFETFGVNLDPPTNATLGVSQQAVRILNDDLPLILMNNVLSVTEGSVATFRPHLAVRYYKTIFAFGHTGNLSAFAPGDYRPLTNVHVTFPAGSVAPLSIPVVTLIDHKKEPAEQFYFTITLPIAPVVGRYANINANST